MSRLSETSKVHLFGILYEEWKEKKHGTVTRTLARLRKRDIFVARHTVTRWLERWKAAKWKFEAADRSRNQISPRKLTPRGVKQLQQAAMGSNSRRLARTGRFSSTSGRRAAVSRNTVTKWAKLGGLVLSEPKAVRIRLHVAHHIVMRLLYVCWILRQTADVLLGIYYSDEQGWPVTLGVNKKNDVIFVPKGQQSTTNQIRRTKGDSTNIFSLWWVICANGVVAYKLFEGTLTVELFHKFLRKFLKPAVRRRANSRFALQRFYHDHVTNSSQLFDPDVMNEVCGEGKWFQHCPPICKEQDGWLQIAASPKVKAHRRKKMVAKKVCECKVADDAIVPSASPELNLAENAQGYLRQLVADRVRSGDVEWRGKVANKMAIVEGEIKRLHRNKRYWQTLFNSNKTRCQDVKNSRGGIHRS